MQIRQSGMPEQAYWETLFDVPHVLDVLRINNSLNNVVELGCGYGTFTIPAAMRIQGILYSFDIDPAMVEMTTTRAQEAGASNIRCVVRDVVRDGFALPESEPIDAVLLFNILHAENPVDLLSLAAKTARSGGRVLAIHWRYDSETPRGPSLDIRPRPEQVVEWAKQAGHFAPHDGTAYDLPPWHYGLEFRVI